MRCVLLSLVLVALVAGPAMADNRNVPSSTLSKMGLASMTPVSDAAGVGIRGRGFALAFGFSRATGGSPDGYLSTSPPQPVAAGFNLSVGTGTFALGGSIAFTK
jgi:hypothetical protein